MNDSVEHESIFIAFSNRYPGKIVKVLAGQQFKMIDKDAFVINPTISQDYETLLTHVDSFTDIIHLLSLKSDKKSLATFDSITQSQDINSLSVFMLLRALSANVNCRMFVFTSCAYKISGSEKQLDPTEMPVFGLIKVASQERPKLHTLGVDLDIDEFDVATPNIILEEVTTFKPSNIPMVAYRANTRYVQVLDKLDIDMLPARNRAIKEHGTYLIAGGSGYLGLETALYLAREQPVNIVLAGRSSADKLSERHKSGFEEIKSLGSKVIYLKADVTDYNECKTLIQNIHTQFGVISGIFVAIKNISHKLIDNLDVDEFAKNVLSKLKGVWLLDALTIQDNPDFMATFSSVSSLTGGPIGADCSASNLFLDSFGDWRNAQGRNTITMNYTLIASDDAGIMADRISMIPPISKEEFLGCLDLCLKKNVGLAIMANFNAKVMKMVLPLIKIQFADQVIAKFLDDSTITLTTELKNQVSESNPNVTNQQTFSEHEIREMLRNVWKEVLGYDDVGINDNFFDIGGASISTVKVIHLIKLQLQVNCEVADLYSYPTIEDLAGYLFKKLNPSMQFDPIEKLLEEIDMGHLSPNQAASQLVE